MLLEILFPSVAAQQGHRGAGTRIVCPGAERSWQFSSKNGAGGRVASTHSGSGFDYFVVQSFSHVQLFVTPWTAARQASLSITNSWSPPKPMSMKSVMPSNHLILCCPLLLRPSIFPSIRVFSTESVLCISWPKYWSIIISPSNEYSGLISFTIDWFDLLTVQGTLKSLLQHHSSKASILQRSAFFIVQLTPIHDYWKNHSFD